VLLPILSTNTGYLNYRSSNQRFCNTVFYERGQLVLEKVITPEELAANPIQKLQFTNEQEEGVFLVRIVIGTLIFSEKIIAVN
jgi:hypothetical protein